MKWQSVKLASDLKLDGVQIDFITEDKTLRGVVLTQGKTIVKFSQENYSSFRAFVPEVEKSYVVTAVVGGIPLSVEFGDEGAAKLKAEELRKLHDVKEVRIDGVDVPPAEDEIPF